jgi:hypothetical protein
MKKLILFILLFPLIIFSQDYKIEKSYDSFEEDTLIYMYANKLDGSSFIGGYNASFNIKLYIKKTGEKSIFVITRLVTQENVFIKDKTLGNSLIIKYDTVKLSLPFIKTEHIIGQICVNDPYYLFQKEQLISLTQSKSVKLRIITSEDNYFEFSFNEDNFTNLKHFVKKYLK